MITEYSLPTAGTVFSAELEIKRSRFIADLRRTSTEDEAREFIEQIRKTYPDARHHCSAMVIHVDGATPIERSSDDGEPSGTAGAPMLQQLKGSSLYDVTCVVTRYFGGIKLGAGGLTHAYSEAVGQVLETVQRAQRSQRELYTVEFTHADAGRCESELRAAGVDITNVEYGSKARYTLAVAPGTREELEAVLASVTKGAARTSAAGSAWVER
ncbi:YigZ family protein [Corynebacterium tapiri]|uniref:YigZ family protein n=1 Tax=Corynebacterium tapiri TaxID=1448266 RepID=A0A5C4U5Q3_9CORY|nr:YigZ family protein [Corynebacterium tapiri]TNL99373.1 YigZ family protein [Corynebacterium tapiri]